ncbi:MAG TPA: PilZ domain-containing protein [Terriglobales bacterium]|nr:PilZ domain-containing protein [Terriglobales bacterium]
MGNEVRSGREQRRFVRLDITEDVRALDENGHDIGRVEKVGAGGMQIRLSDNIPEEQYGLGTKMHVSVIEPGNVRNDFNIEVRVREGKVLGVQFLS